MREFVRWADSGSALQRSVHGTDYALWTTEIELLAGIHFQLAIANWQRAGKKRGPRPKPIPRPKSKTQRRFLGNTVMALDDLDALIGWESPRSKK